MSTKDTIRQAAIDNGWTIKARVGDTHNYGRGGTYAQDIFVIGRVERQLADGTPVIESEHDISVWYNRNGAVRFATGHTYTVPQVIYRRGINTSRGESEKAQRIIFALTARTSDIPSRAKVLA